MHRMNVRSPGFFPYLVKPDDTFLRKSNTIAVVCTSKQGERGSKIAQFQLYISGTEEAPRPRQLIIIGMI